MRRLALTLALSAWLAGPAGAAEPIPIGAINSRTGIRAAEGTAVHQGIVLAMEEANTRGGVAGRPIRLIERDDEGKPERALAAAEELTARHRVAALVGGYVDSLVAPVSEVAERTRTPYLATASLDERLTARGYRYFFRVSSLDSYVRATVGIVREVFRPRQAAILHSTTPGASQLARRQREGLQAAGIAVPVFEPFTPGLADFSPLLARVRDRGVEVLLSDTFFADHLLIVRQMAGAGIRVKAFLGAFGLEFPAVVTELGAASEGLFGTTAWQPGVFVPGDEERSRAFVEAFRARFGRDPIPLAMHGYAAAAALLAALEATVARGETVTGPAVRDALDRVDVATPLGRVAFDEGGDPRFYERAVVQIQDGRHVVVYPPSRARAVPRYPAP